jgi:hypothetical protein
MTFDLLNLLSVAAGVAAAVFLAITLAGIISALVLLGMLEIWLRRRIQEKAVHRYFFALNKADENPRLSVYISKTYPQEDSQGEIYFLLKRFSELGPRVISALAQMNSESFFQLHYRQICGQLLAVINNEAMYASQITEGAPRASRLVTGPLTDLLLLLSVLRNPLSIEILPAAKDARVALDRASREIDALQAYLGNAVNKVTFRFVAWTWAVLYALPLVGASTALIYQQYPAGLGWGGGLATSVGTLIAICLSAALALGSAVSGAVVLALLDRLLASK